MMESLCPLDTPQVIPGTNWQKPPRGALQHVIYEYNTRVAAHRTTCIFQMTERPSSTRPPRCHHVDEVDVSHVVSGKTLQYYDNNADAFFTGTEHHDVSQNIDALLLAITTPPPYRILDFGCGPGRDLVHFTELGHTAIGLDGSPAFVAMARQHSNCEIWLQNFFALDLPIDYFDGVFANASLFHVPCQSLPSVLQELAKTLKPGGVLFSSNPHGDNSEGWNSGRYACFHDLTQWRHYLNAAKFCEIQHYYRPAGKPRMEQPWLATVWKKEVPNVGRDRATPA